MADADTAGGEERFGLDDAQLASLPTVFAPDAMAGKVVLITGGAGGLGRATAWLMARLGARVAVAGRDTGRLDALVAALEGAGHVASAHAVNIREPETVEAMVASVAERHGGFDVLVGAAGGQFPQAAIDFSVKGWRAVIDTNLGGSWFVMQAAARHWRDAGRPGSIINIVAVTTHGLYGVAHSVAARAGVVALSRAVSVEWAPLGIRVNCVAPGTIETAGWRVYSPEARAAYPRSNPMKRVGTAWEVAEACAYLASPAAAYVTGEVLTVDGGAQHWGETWTTPRPDWFGGPVG